MQFDQSLLGNNPRCHDSINQILTPFSQTIFDAIILLIIAERWTFSRISVIVFVPVIKETRQILLSIFLPLNFFLAEWLFVKGGGRGKFRQKTGIFDQKSGKFSHFLGNLKVQIFGVFR